MTLEQIGAIAVAVVLVTIGGWFAYGALRQNEGKDPESGE